MSGPGAVTPDMPPVAWQRLVRDRRRAEDSDADLFGRWWEAIETEIAAAEVREIDFATARTVIENYEWLGNMPAYVFHSYGIFFEGNCAGVVVYAMETGENLGKFDSYGFTGKIVRLARGACVHWAPMHAGSKLIRRSMELLPPKYEVITATVDRRAGEIGTIYQACGFHYVGVMSDGAPRRSAIVNGSRISDRAFNNRRQKLGVSASGSVGHGFTLVAEPRKERYFAFRGPPSVRKRHLRAIKQLIKPYPKRAVGREDEPVPAGASDVRPVATAPDPRAPEPGQASLFAGEAA